MERPAFSWSHTAEYTTQIASPPHPAAASPPPAETQLEPFETIVGAIEQKRGFPMSPEQLAICRHIYHGSCTPVGAVVASEHSRHMMIDSVAGSGKTSTLLMCLWFLPPTAKVLLLSFNKTVQQTLQAEVRRASMQIITSLGRHLPECTVQTCHAHGLAALRRTLPGGGPGGPGGPVGRELSDNKYQTVKGAMVELGFQKSLSSWTWHLQSMLKILMNLALECAADSPPWSEDFVVHTGKKYGVPVPAYNPRALSKTAQRVNETYHNYMEVLNRAYQMCCRRQANFDFSDMVYLPVRLGLPLIQYDVVLIDEAQDLNAVQIEMISRSVKQASPPLGGGRIIFVGDKNQAIYGFRGADTTAIETITQRFNTVQFPLHTCWRCPENVISVAQSIVPYIHARPGAPAGVARIHQGDYMVPRLLKERDHAQSHLILCRTNAPLVKLGLDLLREQVACYLAADTLRGALDQLLQHIESQEWIKCRSLKDRVDRYREWKKKGALEEGEEQIEKNDQLDSLYALVNSLRNPTTPEVRRLIETLFTPR